MSDGLLQKKTTVINADGKDENSGDCCVDDDGAGDDATRVVHSNQDVDMIYDGIDGSHTDDTVDTMDKNVTSVTIRIEAEEGEELE